MIFHLFCSLILHCSEAVFCHFFSLESQLVNVLQELCNTTGKTQTLHWYNLRKHLFVANTSCHLNRNCCFFTLTSHEASIHDMPWHFTLLLLVVDLISTSASNTSKRSMIWTSFDTNFPGSVIGKTALAYVSLSPFLRGRRSLLFFFNLSSHLHLPTFLVLCSSPWMIL